MYRSYKSTLLFKDNELVDFNDRIFTTIANELKMSKESVYLAVNRYAEEISEHVIIKTVEYKSDSDSETSYTPFKFKIPFDIKHKKEFKLDLSENRIFEIKSGKIIGEWTSKLNKELWKVQKMPCCWTFKYAKLISTLNEVKLEASYKECGAVLHGYTDQNIEILKLTAYNIVSSVEHKKKRCIRVSERKELHKELQNSSGYVVRSEITNQQMELGEIEPAHVPNLSTLRKIKAGHEFENIDPIILVALRLLKSEHFYAQCIGDVGLDPFYVFYSTPGQSEYYRLKALKGPCQISIDATGLNLRSSILSSYSKKQDKAKYIFLYVIMLKTNDSRSVPVYQMLSQRHTTHFIQHFLGDWRNSIQNNLVEVVTDESAALMTATVRTFTRCHSINEYCNMCMNVLLEKSSVLPECFIRLDRFHFIRNLHKNKLIKKQPEKKRRIFLGVFGFLLQCSDFKSAEDIIKNLFELSLNEYNDIASIQSFKQKIIDITSTIEMEKFEEMETKILCWTKTRIRLLLSGLII